MIDTRNSPDYSVYFHSSGEAAHTVEMHVLARAYRAAWRSQFATEPLGPHVIGPLDVRFVFADARARSTSAGVPNPSVPLL